MVHSAVEGGKDGSNRTRSSYGLRTDGVMHVQSGGFPLVTDLSETGY